ncbi:MAG TPA: hypothetical protein VK550_35330 [Polyangiaceae bacterium]|nr:hypothetical protein [Polyangiaceae bacterium]
MTYLVFSQESGCPPLERLAAHATRFFSTTLELLEQDEQSVLLRLVCARPALRGEFRIASRATTKDDLMNARDAEVRGQAAGMADLAARCKQVWTIDAADAAAPNDEVYLTLAGICASVALGPVLPPDHSTLFGVRGAIDRRDKALLKT